MALKHIQVDSTKDWASDKYWARKRFGVNESAYWWLVWLKGSISILPGNQLNKGKNRYSKNLHQIKLLSIRILNICGMSHIYNFMMQTFLVESTAKLNFFKLHNIIDFHRITGCIFWWGWSDYWCCIIAACDVRSIPKWLSRCLGQGASGHITYARPPEGKLQPIEDQIDRPDLPLTTGP